MNGDLNEVIPDLAETEGAALADEVRETPHQAVDDRKLGSFRVYLDLLDTAEWLRRQFAGQLETFDVTIDEFRLLEILYREGVITTHEFCKRKRCPRQTLNVMAKRMEARGWIRFEVFELTPSENSLKRLPKRLRDAPRRGRLMGHLSLTDAGTKFMHVVFPRHAKLVFAFMQALDPREQETIGRACRKLREGDVMKMLKEISMEEA